jgi:hypothetical protein
MSGRFEGAYCYARACGSLARSYLGERAASLAMSPRVGEAWRSIFGESPPTLPESALADAAESGLRARPYNALRRIIGPLIEEEPFFAALTRDWEIGYLKELLSAASDKRPEPPALGDDRLDPGFDLEGYPDIDRMLRDSRYRWILDSSSSGLVDPPSLKNKLDKQYYLELWASLPSIPRPRIGSLPELIRIEAELMNIVWALRLKRYYAMGPADIEGLLIELPGAEVKPPALASAGKRLDSRQDWSSWKWARLLGDSRGSDASAGEWSLDLRGLESAAHRYMFRLLYRRLHLESSGYVPLFAYYRIKEFETRAIHGIIEGIKLEAPASEIGSFALDTTGGAA